MVADNQQQVLFASYFGFPTKAFKLLNKIKLVSKQF